MMNPLTNERPDSMRRPKPVSEMPAAPESITPPPPPPENALLLNSSLYALYRY